VTAPILAIRKQRGRMAKRAGKLFEERTLARLLQIGMADGAILATPKIVIGGKPRYTKKVLADIVGIWGNGRGVLCECKLRSTKGKYHKPRPSDFEDHQREKLEGWDKAGGYAFVAYSLDGFNAIIENAKEFFPGPT
jgi:hypothetical protein